ncbi:HEPN domain-containing protein [Actinopolymorpha singaporensis]
MLAQADRYLSSAETLTPTDPDGAYVLAYDAARKALTAVLENQGLRPTTRGGHVALIDAVAAQLVPPLGGVLKPVDRMRARRNRVEYPDEGVPPVTPQEIAETLPKVKAVIDAARKVVEAMPVWS